MAGQKALSMASTMAEKMAEKMALPKDWRRGLQRDPTKVVETALRMVPPKAYWKARSRVLETVWKMVWRKAEMKVVQKVPKKAQGTAARKDQQTV
jgi:hypothetical protein